MDFSKGINKDLLDLQKEYRKGNIKEKDITADKLQDLKKLYNYQINCIEKSIKEDKQKILNIKKRLANSSN